MQTHKHHIPPLQPPPPSAPSYSSEGWLPFLSFIHAPWGWPLSDYSFTLRLLVISCNTNVERGRTTRDSPRALNILGMNLPLSKLLSTDIPRKTVYLLFFSFIIAIWIMIDMIDRSFYLSVTTGIAQLLSRIKQLPNYRSKFGSCPNFESL